VSNWISCLGLAGEAFGFPLRRRPIPFGIALLAGEAFGFPLRRRPIPFGIALLAVALLLPAWEPAGADDMSGAESEAARIRVGVAPFQVAAPLGVEVPDYATLLADLLGTRGVGHIVGPGQLGAPASADVDASAVRSLAEEAAVDGVVVGRTTQIGSRFSVDVRLLSADSGEVVDTYIAEIPRSDQTTSAVSGLADQVIAGLLALTAPPDDPSAPVAPDAVGSPASPRVFDASAPISIKSQSLEAAEVNGGRRLVFNGDVNVVQNDITMTSNRLTADYPKGASEPTRLVAQGAVRVIQGGQEARCDNGTFQRAEELLTCCGNAELRDGSSRVRGKCIEFNLGDQTVRVEDATVNIFPASNESGAGESGGR
jgi:lipopolysaccharide transport protein LptA